MSGRPTTIRVRKYPRGFSRRYFIDQLAHGILVGGVVAPLWSVMAETGDASAAYPDELLSIDEYTGGSVSTGDIIDADNVGLVSELLDPIRYTQVSEMGRRLRILDTTTDFMQLSQKSMHQVVLCVF